MKKLVTIILGLLLSLTLGFSIIACSFVSKDADSETEYVAPEDDPALRHDFVDGKCTLCGELYYSQGLQFTSNGDGTCFVSGLGTCKDTEMYIPQTSPEGDAVTSIGESAFYNVGILKRVVIPPSVTSIGYCAFDNCSNMTAVVIPDSVKKIANLAFFQCTSLESVVIPSGVTSIGDYAFHACTSLISITISDSVKNIGREVFLGCTALTEFITNNDNPKFCSEDGVLFNKSKTELICYPAGNSRTSYAIPDGVTTIGNAAFAACHNLVSVELPKSMTFIGDSNFNGCTNLTSINIPNGVRRIGLYSFCGCSALTEFMIPRSLSSLNDYFLSDCSSLTSIIVEEGNVRYHSTENCLIESATKTLVAGCENSIIPIDGSVTSIGWAAFSGRTGLTSITIPDSVTSIGSFAFSGCTGLTSITIPAGVTSICYDAFLDCTNLIEVENGVSYVDKWAVEFDKSITNLVLRNDTVGIGDGLFSSCSNLSSITIPDGLKSIGREAFYDCCGLTNMTIPASVTSIGPLALYNCSGLMNITFKGTVAEWNSISMGENWSSNVPATKVACSDGEGILS